MKAPGYIAYRICVALIAVFALSVTAWTLRAIKLDKTDRYKSVILAESDDVRREFAGKPLYGFDEPQDLSMYDPARYSIDLYETLFAHLRDNGIIFAPRVAQHMEQSVFLKGDFYESIGCGPQITSHVAVAYGFAHDQIAAVQVYYSTSVGVEFVKKGERPLPMDHGMDVYGARIVCKTGDGSEKWQTTLCPDMPADSLLFTTVEWGSP